MLLLRAYASIWDFVNTIFGTNIPSMPPNTYGFMMAMAFIVGVFLARNELARKTKLGIFPRATKEIYEGQGIILGDVLLYALIGFFLGLKIIGFYLDSSSFLANPQRYIISMQGSMQGGLLVAAVIGGLAIYNQWKNKKNPPEKKIVSNNIEDRIGDVLVICMIGGVLGSKLLDTIDSPETLSDFLSDPIGSLTSGLSVLGGLFTVSILLIGYAIKNKIKVLPFIDSLSPPFFIGYAVGRLGCQFSGDGCWGISTMGLTKPAFLPDFLWGSTYDHNVNREGVLIPGCNEDYCMKLAEPHLPTPLYETIFVCLLFLILWSLRKRLTFHPGAISGLFLVFNGMERFLIEFVRINNKYNYFGFELSQAQYMSIFMILIGTGLTIWAMRHKTDISAIQN
jgi:phosphatidylglycerol:prolipoprotein diacylglycerol transferase